MDAMREQLNRPLVVGIAAFVARLFIGQVVPREQGLTLVEGARQEPLPIFPQDEITRLFA